MQTSLCDVFLARKSKSHITLLLINQRIKQDYFIFKQMRANIILFSSSRIETMNKKHIQKSNAFIVQIIEKTQALLGDPTRIKTGLDITPFLTGFRGKKGSAIAAIFPSTVTELYHLIQLYQELSVGYILQGANTALKGQGTPNDGEMPVVIIKTTQLKQIKILNHPHSEDYKILLVQPGLSLKDAETILDEIGFDLPHKIGSHDFGNTFGASCANGCGGVRVDNRDGRVSSTEKGSLGVVSIGAEGLIYNGFIKPEIIHSGQALFEKIDANTLTIDDIELPSLDETHRFMQQLFISQSYPIKNHRGDIIFAGDGGEGSQAIVYQMYLIRKKPERIKLYTLLFKDDDTKPLFYKDVIFSCGTNQPDALPILCESMNLNLVHEIVNQGVGFASAVFLTLAPHKLSRYFNTLLKWRNTLLKKLPSSYIATESFIGRCLSRWLTPELIRNANFKEMVIVQVADRINAQDNIDSFEKRLQAFLSKNIARVDQLVLKNQVFLEKLILEIRTTGALATETIAQRERGTLFPFDDAIMPGEMTKQYRELLLTRLSERFPGKILPPYFYGHDLKQISHNDWVIRRHCSTEELQEIHALQHQLMDEIGGISHAEHGVGDYADTDLPRTERVKLVAHRLLNDMKGLANPGGSWGKAFQHAILDKALVADGIDFAEKTLARELSSNTLLNWSDKTMDVITKRLKTNITNLLASVGD